MRLHLFVHCATLPESFLNPSLKLGTKLYTQYPESPSCADTVNHQLNPWGLFTKRNFWAGVI